MLTGLSTRYKNCLIIRKDTSDLTVDMGNRFNLQLDTIGKSDNECSI